MSNGGEPPFRGQNLNWNEVKSTQTSVEGAPTYYKTEKRNHEVDQKPPDKALEAPYLDEDVNNLKWDGGSKSKSIPLLLAGPILRRVTYDSVTVWFAAKEQCSVKLGVDELSNHSTPGASGAAYTGTATTRKIGEYLHVACVTAETGSSTPNPETLYYYDLTFTNHNDKTLGSKGIVSTSSSNQNKVPELALSESPVDNRAPTFTFPAKNLEDLRVAFGSCRKPHGQGKDALPAVHEMLNNTANDPANRPNHLVLGGDQIYADDVADQLLAMLINHGRRLLGWDDDLPATMLRSDGQLRLEAWPGRREQPYALQIAGLSAAGYGSSHLLTLGEYLAMYLCVWSPVLWPDDPGGADQFAKFYPSVEDVWPHRDKKTPVKYRKGWGPRQLGPLDEKGWFQEDSWDWERNWLREDVADDFSANINYVYTFRQTLKKVRRLMANVPVYMIFDDHEVTDDWFIAENNVKQVLGSTVEDLESGEPTGQRVIENGMLAYTLFQAWGNAPSKFDSEPGKLLLDYLENVASSDGDQTARKQDLREDELGKLLGRPLVKNKNAGVDRDAPKEGKNPYTLSERSIEYAWDYKKSASHDPVEYNYHIPFGEGNSTAADYELLVFDTRTKRKYPEGGFAEGVMEELKELISGSSPPPELISDESLNHQRPDRSTPTDLDLTLAVSPVPLWTVPSVNGGQKLYARKQMLMNTWNSPGKPTAPNTISPVERAEKEHWRLQRSALERFISALATRGADDSNQENSHRLLVLSGDVHYGYGVRSEYWADEPFVSGAQTEHWQGFDFDNTKFKAVMAACTASAAKNSGDAARLLQGTGYHSMPGKVGTPSTGVVGKQFDSEIPEWANRLKKTVLNPWYLLEEDLSSNMVLTEYALHPMHVLENEKETTKRSLFDKMFDDLQYDVRRFQSDLQNIQKKMASPENPDWQYRIDYLVNDFAERVSQKAINDGMAGLSAQNYDWWVNDLRANFLIEAEDYGRHIIGYNNIGDVTLDWSNETAEFSLWWRLYGSKGRDIKNHATFDVSLSFDDERYGRPNDLVMEVDLS